MKKIIIISLGGSLIAPKEGIDTVFLKKFKGMIEALLGEGFKFILVCGGGYTARDYQRAANLVSKISREELDWLGIEATKLNAKLVQAVFGKSAHKELVADPRKKLNFKEGVLVGAGFRPGCSTDYDVVVLAKAYGVKKIINLTDVDYLHNKNPKIYNDAKKIKEIGWAGFRRIVGYKWVPGANVPFDPIASREAQKSGLTLILANGKKINNLKKIIRGARAGKFIGSIVS